MAIPVTDTHDWVALYGCVEAAAQIPGTRRVEQTGAHLVYRDLLVKMDDVIAAVQAAATPPVFVFIYADVVVLPAARNWALNNMALVVAARRIEATTGTFLQLDYRSANSATLVLYAAQTFGDLQVRAFNAGAIAPVVYDLAQFPALGVQIARDGAATARRDLASIDESLLGFGTDLWIALASIFQYASVLADTAPDVASNMLEWIKTATAPSVNARDLYLQSSAFASQLTLAGSSIGYVPYLSKNVYQQLAGAFEDAAEQYESQYRLFMQDAASVDQWAAAAANMQKSYALTDAFEQRLLQQAIQNAQAAQDAVSQAGTRFTIQKNMAEQKEAPFKAGIEIWKNDQTLKAVFSIFTALLQFAGAIAALAVGDAAAAPAAGAAAAGAADAAGAAVKAGGEAAKVAASMQALADAMKALKVVAESLDKVVGFVEKIVEASQSLGARQQVDNIDIPPYSDISAQAQWDIFRLHTDNMMKFAVDNGIEGADDYREALDDLSIYGKALAATQSSYVQTAQDLARLQTQSQMAGIMSKTLNDYAARLQQDKARDERMMFLVYLRQASVKRWLYLAVLNYNRAFHYWALRDSSVAPSALAPVAALRADLAHMVQDYADTLGAFNPPPQVLNDVVIDIDDAATLKELRVTGTARIVLPLATRAFAGFGRVRLTRVRAWLAGLPGTTPVYVEISTSGTYDDRLGGRTYRFTSSAISRTFEYQGAFGDAAGIIVDGIVADEEKYAYFQPTPFTEWMIRVPAERNPGLSLAAVSKLRLSFGGSVIGQQPGALRAGRKALAADAVEMAK